MDTPRRNALTGPILAEDLDASPVRRDEAGDDAQRRGLADGARAEQHEEAAFRHGQGQVFEGPDAAIRLAQLDQAQRGIVELPHRHSSVSATASDGEPPFPGASPPGGRDLHQGKEWRTSREGLQKTLARTFDVRTHGALRPGRVAG